ncbi:MAG: hypothetical protein J7D60_08430 [Prosthecochloris sp.]|nr:hypothetical protein [Prosthecochloris sp.]
MNAAVMPVITCFERGGGTVKAIAEMFNDRDFWQNGLLMMHDIMVGLIVNVWFLFN